MTMQLVSGTTLGPYEIRAAIGSGGMGDVYRARDHRVDREVALKITHEPFSARFDREARAIAALNHPNICTLYDVGPNYLVMEIVEGRTLAERMASEAIPLEEALDVARQIAAALEHAHERGIVHRDLKPGNIMLKPDGTVKVLDFGLAKLDGPLAASSEAAVTASISETERGTILGTVSYMAPEQALGKPVDKRADIWAFGVVVYEMLTGTRLFSGSTFSEVVAAVLKEDPPWEPVPVQARHLLRWCLEKDSHRRLRDIGDAMRLLDDAPKSFPARTKGASWLMAGAVAVAVAAVTIAVITLYRSTSPGPPDRPLIALDVDLGEGRISGPLATSAIAPDGTRFVFPRRDAEGRQVLAIRLLDGQTTTVLSGTEGGFLPFFSPDGRWIGFFTENKLMKVPVQGGVAVPLADAIFPRGASWAEDGTIVAALTNRSGLVSVGADDGKTQPLTKLEPDEQTHRWPQVLPAGKAVLFTARSPTLNSFENAAIDVQSLTTGERKTVWRGGYFGRYLPSDGRRGHLVYIRASVLFAVPFDPERLEVSGTPVPLLEDVAADPASGGGHVAFSQTGTVVYLRGRSVQSWPISWLDNSGKTRPLVPNPGLYYTPRFSPDGNLLALSMDEGTGSDIYIYDLRAEVMRRLTFTGQMNLEPVWTPDGRHLVFRSITTAAMWWIRADGAGGPKKLLAGTPNMGPYSFSSDGHQLGYYESGTETGQDLWSLPLDMSNADDPKPGTPQLLLGTPATERYPAFSPDGRWIAYESDMSGNLEVYVRPRSGPDAQWQISVGGGARPIWSQTSHELFYQRDDRIMVAGYQTSRDSFQASKPRQWSPTRTFDPGFASVALAPDGKRFAVFPRLAGDTEEDEPLPVTFLLNFFDELRRRLPTGK